MLKNVQKHYKLGKRHKMQIEAEQILKGSPQYITVKCLKTFGIKLKFE